VCRNAVRHGLVRCTPRLEGARRILRCREGNRNFESFCVGAGSRQSLGNTSLSFRACGPRNLMEVLSVTALFSAPDRDFQPCSPNVRSGTPVGSYSSSSSRRNEHQLRVTGTVNCHQGQRDHDHQFECAEPLDSVAAGSSRLHSSSSVHWHSYWTVDGQGEHRRGLEWHGLVSNGRRVLVLAAQGSTSGPKLAMAQIVLITLKR
jgi:hypothetical protein